MYNKINYTNDENYKFTFKKVRLIKKLGKYAKNQKRWEYKMQIDIMANDKIIQKIKKIQMNSELIIALLYIYVWFSLYLIIILIIL